MIKGLAPGTILQFMFVKNRLKKIFGANKSFIEVGSGNGHLSNLLLKQNYIGTGVDLNSSACENNKALNTKFIELKKYDVYIGDFNNIEQKKFDFLISSMVIEHINDEDLKVFIGNAKNIINPNGKMLFLVPSNMDAWGIEDEIAGHVKRYTFKDIDELAINNGLKVDYKCGLNYPVSNWLLKLSNRIVNKNESHLKSKTELEKTIYTGNRSVKYKTVFPSYLNIVLNEIVLLPFYWLQRLNATNKRSLVMYFELSIK
jgi:cyclopropane fatty-acyl-phospholipid synthase-like methyltransferase